MTLYLGHCCFRRATLLFITSLLVACANQTTSTSPTPKDPRLKQKRNGADIITAKNNLSVITNTLDSQKGIIYNFYRRLLRTDPKQSGTVNFQLTIAPSGQVEDVKVISSQILNAAFESQIIKQLKSLHFDIDSEKSIIVDYPVLFVP